MKSPTVWIFWLKKSGLCFGLLSLVLMMVSFQKSCWSAKLLSDVDSVRGVSWKTVLACASGKHSVELDEGRPSSFLLHNHVKLTDILRKKKKILHLIQEEKKKKRDKRVFPNLNWVIKATTQAFRFSRKKKSVSPQAEKQGSLQMACNFLMPSYGSV